jgi:hypothetical protein
MELPMRGWSMSAGEEGTKNAAKVHQGRHL